MLQINIALKEEMQEIHALSIRMAEADSVWRPKNEWRFHKFEPAPPPPQMEKTKKPKGPKPTPENAVESTKS